MIFKLRASKQARGAKVDLADMKRSATDKFGALPGCAGRLTTFVSKDAAQRFEALVSAKPFMREMLHKRCVPWAFVSAGLPRLFLQKDSSRLLDDLPRRGCLDVVSLLEMQRTAHKADIVSRHHG